MLFSNYKFLAYVIIIDKKLIVTKYHRLCVFPLFIYNLLGLFETKPQN